MKRTVIGLGQGNNDYRTREDLHVLKSHAEIKSDPKRHAAAVALAKHEAMMLRKIPGPRAVRGGGK